MKKTLTTHEIANALVKDEYANWTRSGALALAEHLEEIEADCGLDLELDIVAIRCEYSEEESLQEWARGYFTDEQLAEVLEDSEDNDEDLRNYIYDRGQLIEFDGGIIASSF